MSLFKRLLMEKHLLLVLSICLISILTIKTVPAKAVYGGINLETPVAAGLNAGYLYAEVDSSISNYGHHGTDWRATLLPVKAAYNGKVITVTDLGNTSYGKYIIIESDHPDYPGTKFYHLYAHLSRQDVSQGQTVTKGQQIGVSGNTEALDTICILKQNGKQYWYAQRNPEGLLLEYVRWLWWRYGRVKTSSDA